MQLPRHPLTASLACADKAPTQLIKCRFEPNKEQAGIKTSVAGVLSKSVLKS